MGEYTASEWLKCIARSLKAKHLFGTWNQIFEDQVFLASSKYPIEIMYVCVHVLNTHSTNRSMAMQRVAQDVYPAYLNYGGQSINTMLL